MVARVGRKGVGEVCILWVWCRNSFDGFNVDGHFVRLFYSGQE